MEMKNYFENENAHNLRVIVRIFASLCWILLVSLQLHAQDGWTVGTKAIVDQTLLKWVIHVQHLINHVCTRVWCMAVYLCQKRDIYAAA